MDSSPSRQSASQCHDSDPLLRSDKSKSLPKSIGEQKNLPKQKSVSYSYHPLAAKVSTVSETKSKNKPAPSRIPMKRTPTSITPSRAASTPLGMKQPTKTASKVSLGISNISKNLDLKNSKNSKACIKTPTSATFRSPFSAGQKSSLPAKGFGLSGAGRRGSNISCRSSRSQRNEDSADGSGSTFLPRITSTHGDHDAYGLTARERVAENNKLKVFENLHKKLQDMQSEFMHKFENLKLISPEKLKNTYKFITMVKNDECKLMITEEDQKRIPKKLPATSINDFKEEIRKALDSSLYTLLDNLNSESDPPFRNLEETRCKLEELQREQLCGIYGVLHDLCSLKNTGGSDGQIVSMQKEIQDGKKTLHALEKKISDIRRDHADELLAHEKELREKSGAEVIKRDILIAELTKKQKLLEKEIEKLMSTMHQSNEESNSEQADKIRLLEELQAYKENMLCMGKKLALADTLLAQEKKEKQDRLDTIHKLENDLDVAHKKIKDLLVKSKDDYLPQIELQERELMQVKAYVEGLEREKKDMEGQVEQMSYDVLTICDLRNKLSEADDHISELQALLQERDSELSDKSELPKEVLNELSKLRQSETEKRREIEKLRMELSKVHFTIRHMEEQKDRDQQMLDVRSELINSLQANDNIQRLHIDQLFAQIAEKNNIINEISNELRTKTEEFRNLFTTLSTKQLELSRQEHMIKLLEESNERSQMLRVKQEDKIGQMEEEITQLKHAVSVFYSNKRPNENCKNLLFAPAQSGDEYNENFYNCTKQRRRKRQADINVKKYEM